MKSFWFEFLGNRVSEGKLSPCLHIFKYNFWSRQEVKYISKCITRDSLPKQFQLVLHGSVLVLVAGCLSPCVEQYQYLIFSNRNSLKLLFMFILNSNFCFTYHKQAIPSVWTWSRLGFAKSSRRCCSFFRHHDSMIRRSTTAKVKIDACDFWLTSWLLTFASWAKSTYYHHLQLLLPPVKGQGGLLRKQLKCL